MVVVVVVVMVVVVVVIVVDVGVIEVINIVVVEQRGGGCRRARGHDGGCRRARGHDGGCRTEKERRRWMSMMRRGGGYADYPRGMPITQAPPPPPHSTMQVCKYEHVSFNKLASFETLQGRLMITRYNNFETRTVENLTLNFLKDRRFELLGSCILLSMRNLGFKNYRTI